MFLFNIMSCIETYQTYKKIRVFIFKIFSYNFYIRFEPDRMEIGKLLIAIVTDLFVLITTDGTTLRCNNMSAKWISRITEELIYFDIIFIKNKGWNFFYETGM